MGSLAWSFPSSIPIPFLCKPRPILYRPSLDTREERRDIYVSGPLRQRQSNKVFLFLERKKKGRELYFFPIEERSHRLVQKRIAGNNTTFESERERDHTKGGKKEKESTKKIFLHTTPPLTFFFFFFFSKEEIKAAPLRTRLELRTIWNCLFFFIF